MTSTLEAFVIALFGWPGAVTGGLMMLAGIAYRKAWLTFAGAFLSAGFCVYIGMNPTPLRWVGLIALAGNFLSAAAVWRNSVWLAALLVIPFLGLATFTACVVFTPDSALSGALLGHVSTLALMAPRGRSNAVPGERCG